MLKDFLISVKIKQVIKYIKLHYIIIFIYFRADALVMFIF